MFPELDLIKRYIFEPCELEVTNLEAESEGREYRAHHFQLGKLNIKFRTAKITPTKTGQFVTIWKRNAKGTTQPFDISDPFDFYMIATTTNTKSGVFIFPKEILHKHGILSDNTGKGKRGIRLYPIWDLTTSKQAQKTQQWQTEYFLDLSGINPVEFDKIKLLLQPKDKEESKTIISR